MSQKSMDVCRELLKWSGMNPRYYYNKNTGSKVSKPGLTEFQYMAEIIVPMAEEALKEKELGRVVVDESKKEKE